MLVLPAAILVVRENTVSPAAVPFTFSRRVHGYEGLISHSWPVAAVLRHPIRLNPDAGSSVDEPRSLVGHAPHLRCFYLAKGQHPPCSELRDGPADVIPDFWRDRVERKRLRVDFAV